MKPFMCGLFAAGALALSSPRAEAIYGNLSLTCNAPAADLQEAARWDRVSSRSAAFAGCLDTSMRSTRQGPYGTLGPYRKCQVTQGGVAASGYRDPFYDSDIDTQIARALDATRSSNDVIVDCAPTCSSDRDCEPICTTNTDCDTTLGQTCVANRCIGKGTQTCLPSGWCTQGTFSGLRPETAYYTTAPEELSTQVAPIGPSLSVEAGSIAHEAMHQHGYVHGSTDGADGTIDDLAGSCGYAANDATFNPRNSIPYIVGDCIQYVLDQSQSACGADWTSGCPNGGLRIVDTLDQTHCTCVDDQHDPFTQTGYVCMTGRSPYAADPNGGSAGYLYVSINDAPHCGGHPLEDGYIYSTGATYTGAHWSSTALYSEAALGALYRSLARAGKAGKTVRLTGTNERPHFQVQTITIYGK